jgi:thiol:disulfide interchange protein DsbD
VLQKPRGGYGASFAEGVFATVLATPCTAPFLGAALGFAFSQPAWAILLIFATVAAGMAVPYLLLTAIPAWVRFLPKPGMWMETAKQLMGFLMMATLVWLLYILGREVGVEGMAWTAAFLLTIGFVCWMIGRFLTLEATRGRALTVWAIALVLTGAGYLLFIAPVVRSGDASGAASASGEGAQERGGLLWEPFSTGALETHLRENRAVLVDFTAEWCLTCKVNERTVLADRDVVEKIRTAGIVTVRADWTNRNPDITRLLAKFGRSGVPLYVLFPAGRPSEPIVLPEVITSAVIMEAVDRAIAKNG